jgi:hypothetical protein
VILAFFDRHQVLDAISQNGKVELTASGKLTSGAAFSGKDYIWIFKPPQTKKSHPLGKHKNK